MKIRLKVVYLERAGNTAKKEWVYYRKWKETKKLPEWATESLFHRDVGNDLKQKQPENTCLRRVTRKWQGDRDIYIPTLASLQLRLLCGVKFSGLSSGSWSFGVRSPSHRSRNSRLNTSWNTLKVLGNTCRELTASATVLLVWVFWVFFFFDIHEVKERGGLYLTTVQDYYFMYFHIFVLLLQFILCTQFPLAPIFIHLFSTCIYLCKVSPIIFRMRLGVNQQKCSVIIQQLHVKYLLYARHHCWHGR